MIYTYAATALLSAGMAFYGGWSVNQWRHDASQKQAVEQAAASERELHRMEQSRSSAALAAQVVARKSEARLRADAAASQSAYVGLRGTTDQALRTAATSLEACVAISATLGELQLDGAKAYRELATKADEHLIDLRAQLDSP